MDNTRRSFLKSALALVGQTALPKMPPFSVTDASLVALSGPTFGEQLGLDLAGVFVHAHKFGNLPATSHMFNKETAKNLVQPFKQASPDLKEYIVELSMPEPENLDHPDKKPEKLQDQIESPVRSLQFPHMEPAALVV